MRPSAADCSLYHYGARELREWYRGRHDRVQVIPGDQPDDTTCHGQHCGRREEVEPEVALPTITEMYPQRHAKRASSHPEQERWNRTTHIVAVGGLPHSKSGQAASKEPQDAQPCPDKNRAG
ncbi:MAG: hypothetical protein K6U89_19865 [Chloroflexi bacterium]|nr:hypothetical protein [Chloroflexota bacterium]